MRPFALTILNRVLPTLLLTALSVMAQNGIKPTPAQVAWHKLEAIGFMHIGPNSYINLEWGSGKEPVNTFMPTETKYDPDQWVKAFKAAGMKMVLVVAKHHDGFCLFQTQYTDFSLKKSPWKGGMGDVVKDVSEACRKNGLKFGVYLSPGDFNYPDQTHYNTYFGNQLRELLGGNYGTVTELWFDGANAVDFSWIDNYKLAKQLNPDIVVFNSPDLRWVGNETCTGTETNVAVRKVGYGPNDNPANGWEAWNPDEADCSYHQQWFYYAPPKPQGYDFLKEKYFTTVGRSAMWTLNVPPNRDGRFDPADSANLYRFGRWLADTAFKYDLALGGTATASNVRGSNFNFRAANAIDTSWESFWSVDPQLTTGSLEVALNVTQPAPINMVVLQEYIPNGQYVSQFTVDAWVNGAWQQVTSGTTIMYKRILRFNDVITNKVRLNIKQANEAFFINRFSVYDQQARMAPVPTRSISPKTATATLRSLEFQRGELVYNLDSDAWVKLEVFDQAGKLLKILAEGRQAAGLHQVAWDALGHGQGVQVARLRTGDSSVLAKIIALQP